MKRLLSGGGVVVIDVVAVAVVSIVSEVLLSAARNLLAAPRLARLCRH